MRTRTDHSLALALGAITAGCGGGAPSPDLPDPAAGPVTYYFRERVPDAASLTLEGRFVISDSLVEVEAQWAPCVREPVTSHRIDLFTCGLVQLQFSRIDPIRDAYYSTTIRVPVSEVVCLEYRPSDRGGAVCVRSRTEQVYRDVGRSGRIYPKPSPR
jgi:hypothetical protein